MKKKAMGIALAAILCCLISSCKCDGIFDQCCNDGSDKCENPTPTPATPVTPVTPTRAEVKPGCYSASYSGYANSQMGCGLLSSFGDSTFDAVFWQEVAIQRSFWAGNPANVYPFDECQGSINALSFPEHYILFGVNLVRYTIISTRSDLAIAGELGHEWGHQVQFYNGWFIGRPPRDVELEADAFGGYYLGLQKGWAGYQLKSYIQTVASLGDYDFNSPQAHGTPDERAAAGGLGLSVAAWVINNNIRLSYAQLHDTFVNSAPILRMAPGMKPHSGAPVVESRVMEDIDQTLIQRIASGKESLDKINVPEASDSKREELRPF